MENEFIKDGILRALCKKASELYARPQDREEWMNTVRKIKTVAEYLNVWAGKVRIREQVLAGKDPYEEAIEYLKQEGIDYGNFDKAAAKIMSEDQKAK